jgi:hypothetical protein
LSWIKSVLANRDQQVILDGAKSNSAPVSSGVPQETVLGPLLFLVYTIDFISPGLKNGKQRYGSNRQALLICVRKLRYKNMTLHSLLHEL